MKIIFTELQQQDPFKPNDSSALLDQLNSIRQIESDMQLTEQLESIVFQNQLASASNMIGKVVQGVLPTGDRVAGQVLSVILALMQVLPLPCCLQWPCTTWAWGVFDSSQFLCKCTCNCSTHKHMQARSQTF